MRLWHQDLIPHLPRQQLLGMHREICALRGKGWGKKHATVDYVFKNPFNKLLFFHFQVMLEMKRRGYKASEERGDAQYRGKKLGIDRDIHYKNVAVKEMNPVYEEHDNTYLKECIENLREKNIELDLG